ncbi:MAG TPA: hypothetical protein VGN12_27375 [Pirellulales bacterium]|jgi:hypothetical protein
MNRTVSNLVLFAALMAPRGIAEATPITNLYGTGLAADGSPLGAGAIDAHYSIISAPTGSGLGPSAFVALDTTPYPFDGWWLANGMTSQWIAPVADQNGAMPGGDYDYQTTFDITGIDPSTLLITGQWAVDDAAYVLVNGQSTGIVNTGGWSQFSPLSVSAGFVSGVNTLDFIVHNIGDPGLNGSGLQVQLSGSQVPEPGTAFLAIAALGYIAIRHVRFSRSASSFAPTPNSASWSCDLHRGATIGKEHR